MLQRQGKQPSPWDQALVFPWKGHLLPEFCTQWAVDVDSVKNFAEPAAIRKRQSAQDIVSQSDINEYAF